MSWADWYALETAASTEKIIANWIFLVVAICASKRFADWITK